MDSSVWKNPIIWFVWSWCMLKANHQDNEFPFNGEDVLVKKGSFITGLSAAKEELPSLSLQNIRTAFEYLKSTGRITVKSNNKFSMITIVKWESYQSDNIQTNKPLTNHSQATNKPLTTNKNDKKEKNSSADAPEGIRIESDMLENKKPKKRVDEHILEVFRLFSPKYPRIWESNVSQRKAAEFLSERGIETVTKALAFYRDNDEFSDRPQVVSPWDLENKWPNLMEFKKRHNL